MLKFKVNRKGNLERVCPKGNTEFKKCLRCDDLLTIEPRGLGNPPSRIWCRGAGIEGYNYVLKRGE